MIALFKVQRDSELPAACVSQSPSCGDEALNIVNMFTYFSYNLFECIHLEQ